MNDDSPPEFTYEWRKVVPKSLLLPSLRSGLEGVSFNQDLWLIGGRGAGQFNECWCFSLSQPSPCWTQVVCNSAQMSGCPCARDGHSLTKISDSKLILFGGQGELFQNGKFERQTEHGRLKAVYQRTLFDDIFELDISSCTWSSLPRTTPRPTPRRGHSLSFLHPGITPGCSDFDSSEGCLVLFGGSANDPVTGAERLSNEVFLYSLKDHTWTRPVTSGVAPLPTFGHRAVVRGDLLYIVGGSVLALRDNDVVVKGEGTLNVTRGDNFLSVLDLLTMMWTTHSVSVSSPHTIMLLGHTLVSSPIDSRYLYILGGVAAYKPPVGGADEPADAHSLVLDLEELNAVPAPSVSCPPEARVNHVAVSMAAMEGVIAPRKKKTKEIPAPPQRPPELTRLYVAYGGTRVTSPGFCTGDVLEYVRVMVPTSRDCMIESTSVTTPLNLKTMRLQSGVFQCSARSLPLIEQAGVAFRDDKSYHSVETLSELLSSKYGGIKSALTANRSQCFQTGTSIASHSTIGKSVSTSAITPTNIAMTKKEALKLEKMIIRAQSEKLAPLVSRGMSIHEARLAYDKIYPSLGGSFSTASL